MVFIIKFTRHGSLWGWGRDSLHKLQIWVKQKRRSFLQRSALSFSLGSTKLMALQNWSPGVIPEVFTEFTCPLGTSKVGCPSAALRRPFFCTQAALGGSSTCSYTTLLASVVCNHCQKPPRRVLGQALSGNKKSPECGSWPHKCEDVQSPSRDSHFPFHITTSLMSRGNPLSLGTVAENGPLKFMWHR